MSAAATAPERSAPPPAQAMDVRVVPIELVQESAWNPRKHWVTAQDADLEASIRKVGILTPLLVRPVDAAGHLCAVDEARDHYELAAGHRRRRAAAAAGLAYVPIQVRHMSDEEFREVLIVENLQRADIHPLDEADAYDALRKTDGAYTPEAIAARVGKSTSYVYKRLKLTDLTEACREAYWKDEITAAHAERLARLAPAQQDQALEDACFHELFDRVTDDDRREPAPVSQLDEWIERHTKVETASPETQHYFPEVTEQLRELEEQHAPPKILQLSDSHHVNVDLGTKKHGALGAGRWKEIGRYGVKACANVQKGVVVHGGPMRIIDVCATKGCPKHFPPRKAAPSSSPAQAKGPDKWELDNQRRERERTAWNAVKPDFFKLAAARGKEIKPAAVCDLVLDELFRDKQDRKAAETLVGPLTPDTFRGYVLVAIAFRNSWGLDEAKRAAKVLGLDLGELEKAFKAKVKELTPKPAPQAEKTSAKKAKARR